jgi:hypothetical protein
MNPVFRSLVVAVCAALIGSGAWADRPARKLLDIHQAIAIAEGAIKSNGVDRSSIELVGVRRHRSPYNELIPRKPTLQFDKDLFKKLDGRTYWYVTYSTPGAEMGGQYAVFVDAGTAEVIYFYIGR